MNYIRLARYFYSKRYMQEIILVIQLILMFLFSIVVLSPIDAYLQYSRELREVYSSVEYTHTLFFNPNYITYDHSGRNNPITSRVINSTVKDALKLVGTEDVMRMAYYTAHINEDSSPTIDSYNMTNQKESDIINLLVYSDELLEATGLLSSEEIDIYLEQNSSVIPILVSQSLSDLIPLGTTTEISLVESGINIPCLVVGVLSEDTILPASHGFASFPSLACLGTRLSDIPGADFIAIRYNSKYFPEILWESSFFVTLDEEISVLDTINTLNAEVGAWGNFSTLEDLENQAFYHVLRQNRGYIFEFFLLSLIAFFGYGGYLFLLTIQRQKEFSIFYILGMTRKKMLAMNCVFGCFNLLISFLIAYTCYPLFQKVIGGSESTTIGIMSILYCLLLFLAVLMFSFLSAFHRFRNITTISLFQGGD